MRIVIEREKERHVHIKRDLCASKETYTNVIDKFWQSLRVYKFKR